MIDSDLTSKSIIGSFWSIIEKIGVQSIKVVILIILARLLGPEEFGLIAIIMFLFTIAQIFVEAGFTQAYIQKKKISDIDSNTVFYSNFLISLIFYFFVYLLAPIISEFYNQPKLIDLIRVTGIILIINSFYFIQNAILTKQINFKKKAKITLLSSFLSGIISIYLAYINFGVWSLVFHIILNKLFLTIGLWLTSNWKPKLQFSFKSLNNLFSFGSWILLSSLFKSFSDNLYILFIGKVYSIYDLGLYNKSKQIPLLISAQATSAIALVAFPIFSKLQNNNKEFRKKFSDFLFYSFALISPFLVVLIVISESFVILVLTEKWLDIIPYLRIVAFNAILYPIHAINVQSLIAKGYSRLNFRIEFIKNILRFFNIFITYKYGIIYILIGETCLSFISLFINTYYTNKIINYGLFKQLNHIKYLVLNLIISGFFGLLFSFLFNSLLLSFLIGILSTLLVYFILFIFLFKDYFYKINNIVQNLRS